jgi:hypothetical protein
MPCCPQHECEDSRPGKNGPRNIAPVFPGGIGTLIALFHHLQGFKRHEALIFHSCTRTCSMHHPSSRHKGRGPVKDIATSDHSPSPYPAACPRCTNYAGVSCLVAVTAWCPACCAARFTVSHVSSPTCCSCAGSEPHSTAKRWRTRLRMSSPRIGATRRAIPAPRYIPIQKTAHCSPSFPCTHTRGVLVTLLFLRPKKARSRHSSFLTDRCVCRYHRRSLSPGHRRCRCAQCAPLRGEPCPSPVGFPGSPACRA